MQRLSLSSSTKLAALLFAAVFLPTLVMLGFMNVASARALAVQQVELVNELRNDLVAQYQSAGPQGLTEAVQDRLALDPHGNEVIAYADPAGHVLVGNLTNWPSIPAGTMTIAEMRRADDPTRKPALLSVTILPDGSRLVTGHVTGATAQLDSANRAGLLLAALIAGPLSLALAFILVRIIERRAERIARVTEAFGNGDFTRRLPVGSSGDTFDRLARTLNAMLDRIETLVGELRLVTDSLAHDLRSPVTRLQAAVEQAASKARDPDAIDALQRAGMEANALQGMLSTALQISRAEAGIGRDRFVPVALDELLGELEEIYGPVAEDAGFRLHVEADGNQRMMIHRELMAQALSNLVDNALNYAHGGQEIRLAAHREADQLVISVRDDGPGIPENRRAEALRRFGRLDPSRHEAGSGLGLALAEAAARLHGGRIELGDAEPGLIVRIILPKSLLQSAA